MKTYRQKRGLKDRLKAKVLRNQRGEGSLIGDTKDLDKAKKTGK